MTIKPLYNHLLVQPCKIETEFKTANDGIMTSKCTVIAVGSECKLIKVGDTVIANYWSPDEIEVDGEKLFFVKEDSESIKAVYVTE